jgi:3'-5' exoribonuclease 1
MDDGTPPIFLRGPLIDIRKGIASLYKWEQLLQLELTRAKLSRSAQYPGFGGADGFQVIPPPAVHSDTVKEDVRTTRLSTQEQSVAGLLDVLNIGPFQGREHCGMDDTINIGRIVVELARRISQAAVGTQILLTKNFEAVDGEIETQASVLHLDARRSNRRARQMEKLLLAPNVATSNPVKQWFWMDKRMGNVRWPFPPEDSELDKV